MKIRTGLSKLIISLCFGLLACLMLFSKQNQNVNVVKADNTSVTYVLDLKEKVLLSNLSVSFTSNNQTFVAIEYDTYLYYYIDGSSSVKCASGITWTADEAYKTITFSSEPTNADLLDFLSKNAKQKFTITYNLNEGTNDSSNPTYYLKGVGATLADPTRIGYTFKGWYSDSEFTTKVESISTGATGNITLYAKWEETIYSVTYDANTTDAVTNMPSDSTEYKYGNLTVTVDTTTIPVRTGYKFVGWNTDSSAIFRQSFTDNQFEIQKDTTLYAIWAENNHYTYDDGGWNVAPETSYNKGDVITIISNSTTSGFFNINGKQYYHTTIGSWVKEYTVKNNGATLVLDVNNESNYGKAYLTDGYKVTYVDNVADEEITVPTDSNYYGGESFIESSKTFIYGNTVTVSSETPVRVGYNFVGWNTQANGNGTSYSAGNTFEIGTSNVTLYAIWKSYTVTYHFGNSEIEIEVEKGSHPTLPKVGSMATTSKGDKYFNGWYNDENCTDGNEFSTSIYLSGNIDVYAKLIDSPDVLLEGKFLSSEYDGHQNMVVNTDDDSSSSLSVNAGDTDHDIIVYYIIKSSNGFNTLTLNLLYDTDVFKLKGYGEANFSYKNCIIPYLVDGSGNQVDLSSTTSGSAWYTDETVGVEITGNEVTTSGQIITIDFLGTSSTSLSNYSSNGVSKYVVKVIYRLNDDLTADANGGKYELTFDYDSYATSIDNSGSVATQSKKILGVEPAYVYIRKNAYLTVNSTTDNEVEYKANYFDFSDVDVEYWTGSGDLAEQVTDYESTISRVDQWYVCEGSVYSIYENSNEDEDDRTKPIELGTYYLKFSAPRNKEYLAISDTYISLTVIKRILTLTVVVDPSSKTYNGSEQSWTTEFKVSTTAEGYSTCVTSDVLARDGKTSVDNIYKITNYSNNSKTDVGTQTATVTVTAGSNFRFVVIVSGDGSDDNPYVYNYFSTTKDFEVTIEIAKETENKIDGLPDNPTDVTDVPDPNETDISETRGFGRMVYSATEGYSKFYDNVYIYHNLKSKVGTIVVEYSTDGTTWETFVNPTYAQEASKDGTYALVTNGSIKDAGTYYVRYYVVPTDNYDGINYKNNGFYYEYETGKTRDYIYKVTIKAAKLAAITFNYDADTAASWSDTIAIDSEYQNSWRSSNNTSCKYGAFTLSQDTAVAVKYSVGDTSLSTNLVYANSVAYASGDNSVNGSIAVTSSPVMATATTTANPNYVSRTDNTSAIIKVVFKEGLHERQATNGVEGVEAFNDYYIFSGQGVSLTNPTVSGYSFVAWTNESSDTKDSGTTPATLTLTRTASGYLNNLVGKEIGKGGSFTNNILGVKAGDTYTVNLNIYYYSSYADCVSDAANGVITNKTGVLSITNDNLSTALTLDYKLRIYKVVIGTGYDKISSNGSTINIYAFYPNSYTDYEDGNNKNENIYDILNVTSDIVLTARWSLKNVDTKWYSVEEPTGDDTTTTITVEYGDYVVYPATPSKSSVGENDYEFSNWVEIDSSTDPETVNTVSANYIVTNEGPFYPRFSAVYNKFNVVIKIYDEYNHVVKTISYIKDDNGDNRIVATSSETTLTTIFNDQTVYSWYLLKGFYSVNGITDLDVTTLTDSNKVTSIVANDDSKTDSSYVYNLCAWYKFDIGTGNVNGDTTVNASMDITYYRRWIVGGYNINVVQANKEWATVYGTDEEVENQVVHTAGSYDNTKIYFLKRVSDVNSDEQSDVRDVTTIRMAIVGGYGYYINTGHNVTNQENETTAVSEKVTTLAELTASCQNELSSVEIQGDIADATNDFVISDEGNQYSKIIDLANHSLTLNSITVKSGSTLTLKDGTVNASIVVEGGGKLVLDGVTATSSTLTIKSNTDVTISGSTTINTLETPSDQSNINVTIEDGVTINNTVTLDSACTYIIKGGTFNKGLECSNGTLIIKGGKFGLIEGSSYAINVTTNDGFYIDYDSVENASAGSLSQSQVYAEHNTINQFSITNSDLNVDVLYDTFADAYAIASENQVINLESDVTFTETVTISKNTRINLNGHTLTNSANAKVFIVVNDALLYINGTKDSSKIVGRINVGAATDNNGHLEINGGTYEVSNNTFIHVNGTCTSSSVVINAATITSNGDNAIQFNGSGSYTIKDSTIEGHTAVYIKSGTLSVPCDASITKSTLKAVGDKASYVYNANGSTSTGDAVVVDACGYPGGSPSVTISADTTITSENGSLIAVYNYGDNVATVSAGTIQVDTYKVVKTEEELRSAVSVDNASVLIANDISLTSALNFVKLNTVLNLNGHTLSGKQVSVNYNINKTGRVDTVSVTIKNGKINSSSEDTVWYGLQVFGTNSTVVLNDVECYGKWGGLATNGNDKNTTSTLTATSCKFVGNYKSGEVSASNGAYLPGNYTYSFDECEFSAECGVVCKSGTFTFTSCTFVSNAAAYIAGQRVSGKSEVSGVAVALQPMQPEYGLAFNVTISGGSASATGVENGLTYRLDDFTTGENYTLSITGCTGIENVSHSISE